MMMMAPKSIINFGTDRVNNNALLLVAGALIAVFLLYAKPAVATPAATAATNVHENNNNNILYDANGEDAGISALLAATRSDLRTLFPTRKDLVRFVLNHREALLQALQQQQQMSSADEEQLLSADDLLALEQQQQLQQLQQPAWPKRAQATYLRFGRSARLRFGKRAYPFDDIVLGGEGGGAHTAARRSARLRFG